MERCQTDKEFLGQAPKQQQYQPKHQQQTTAEEQRCPFFLPTTPAWGDRNVSEQSAEETNNNFGYSFAHLNPSTSDAETPTFKHKKSPSTSSSSSILSLNESTMNNQPSSDVTQLPRKCILCPYVAKHRAEYIEHVITHCVYMKSSYVENNVLNGYIEDEDTDDSTIELPSKGKKKCTGAKPKPCSVCNFTAKTRLSLWMHLRQHFVRNECPGFVCTLCPFATMLKHHMTFHWFSAHDDFRGFNCKECSYTCVSKSMLTSHMKTHSNVYQYNCASCPYKTKFCNAMKKHLKDSMHIPRMVLNPDGSPNPFITIDVYGNKRGPRQRPFVEGKKNLTEIIEDKPSTSGASPSVASIPISSTPRSPRLSRASISSTVTSGSPDSNVSLPTPSSSVRISPTQTPHQSPYSNSLVTATLAMFNSMNSENGVNPSISEQFSNTDAFSVLCQLLFKDIAARQNVDDKEQGQVFRLLGNAQKFLLGASQHVEHTASTTDTDGDLFNNEKNIDKLSTPTTPPSVSEPQPAAGKDDVLEEPLDLSMSAMSRSENQPQFQQSVASSSRRNKRKRKAMKLEYPTDENTNDDEILTWNTNQIYTEPSLPALLTASRSDYQAKDETPNVTHNANINDTKFVCYHCHIIFGNEIMYAVHMSFHNAKNPLMCAVCDQKSANIIAFFLHLIRTKH